MNLFEFFVVESNLDEAEPKPRPAWYDNKKKVDPATEFLKNKGYTATGKPIGQPKDADWDAKPDMSVAAAFGAKGAGLKQPHGNSSIPAVNRLAPDPTTDKVPDELKPKYRGTMIGQSVDMGGRQVPKNVGWQDKESGEKRFGKVMSWERDKLVWDGNDWVTPQQFALKNKK